MTLLASDGTDYCPTEDKSLNFLCITDFLIWKNKIMMIYFTSQFDEFYTITKSFAMILFI